MTMAGDGIYRKTDKGRDEIATRANKLGLRERTMLIMVDDKTTRAGLLAKNSHPTSEGILDDLLAGGYIEIVRHGRRRFGRAQVRFRAPVPSPRPPRRLPLRLPGRPTGRSFDAIGLALRLPRPGHPARSGGGRPDGAGGKVQGVEELTARLEKCRDVVQAMAGKRKAEEFWAGASARLPKA
jgi:DNA-binding PadR family transcriptional regulator